MQGVGQAASDTTPGGGAPNSSPFMAGCTCWTSWDDPAWQKQPAIGFSSAGDGLLAGGRRGTWDGGWGVILTLPVPDGEGLLEDSGSQAKSEAEGSLDTSSPSFPSVHYVWGRNLALCPSSARTGCVKLGVLLDLSEPPFPCLSDGVSVLMPSPEASGRIK